MHIKKMNRCFGVLGFLFVGTAMASEMTSQTPPPIFQKTQEGYWKFALPLKQIECSAVEKAVTNGGIDALELNSLDWGALLFNKVGHVIKKLLVREEILYSFTLNAFSVFPQADRIVDVDRLHLSQDETDKQVGEILSVCTAKLSDLFLYNKKLTLSFLDEVPAEKFKNLKKLLLADMKLPADKLQIILNGAPNLEDVDLHYVGAIEGKVTWKNQAHLLKLRLMGTEVPLDFIKDVLTCNQKLAFLELDRVYNSIGAIEGLQHNALEHFSLCNDPVTLNDIVTIGKAFPFLTYLHVRSNGQLNEFTSSEAISELMLKVQKQIQFFKKLLLEISKKDASLTMENSTSGEVDLYFENVPEDMRNNYRVTIEEI